TPDGEPPGSVSCSARGRRYLPSIGSGDYSRSPAFEFPLHGFHWMAEPHEPMRPLCFSRRSRPYPRPACMKDTTLSVLRTRLGGSHNSDILKTCLSDWRNLQESLPISPCNL